MSSKLQNNDSSDEIEAKEVKSKTPAKKTTKKADSAVATKTKPAAKASSKAASVKTPVASTVSFTNKTKFINPETADRKWFLIDAKGKNLGRMCVEIAKILRGKRKPSFTPNNDAGDFVVVINAAEVDYTGKNKGEQTIYYRYTGYPGGLRQENLENLLVRSPEKVIMKTVRGMLPKNTTVGDKQLTKLKVYGGSKHPHSAQNPVLIDKLPLV